VVTVVGLRYNKLTVMRAASKSRNSIVSYPELSKCVYVLGLQECVIVTVQ